MLVDRFSKPQFSASGFSNLTLAGGANYALDEALDVLMGRDLSCCDRDIVFRLTKYCGLLFLRDMKTPGLLKISSPLACITPRRDEMCVPLVNEEAKLAPAPMSCVQAFFLEDVLVQTDYLKEIGADTGAGGGGKGLLGGGGVEELEAAGADSYNCALCGKGGFRCVVVFVLVVCAPTLRVHVCTVEKCWLTGKCVVHPGGAAFLFKTFAEKSGFLLSLSRSLPLSLSSLGRAFAFLLLLFRSRRCCFCVS